MKLYHIYRITYRIAYAGRRRAPLDHITAEEAAEAAAVSGTDRTASTLQGGTTPADARAELISTIAEDIRKKLTGYKIMSNNFEVIAMKDKQKITLISITKIDEEL